MTRPEVRAKALEIAVRSMADATDYTGYLRELARRAHRFAHYIAEDSPHSGDCGSTCFYRADVLT